jgi:hypothetical protein
MNPLFSFQFYPTFNSLWRGLESKIKRIGGDAAKTPNSSKYFRDSIVLTSRAAVIRYPVSSFRLPACLSRPGVHRGNSQKI